MATKSLYDLRDDLDVKIAVLERVKLRDRVENEVWLKGYSRIIKLEEPLELMDPNMLSTTFPLYMEVYTRDKRFKTRVGELSDDQNGRFYYMSIDYTLGDKWENCDGISQVNIKHSY